MNTFNKENPDIKPMFENVAKHYDLLNKLLSLTFDRYWRKVLAKKIVKNGTNKILDIACGTGDVILAILKEKKVEIVGLDFAPNMLKAAEKKLKNIKNSESVKLIQGDCLNLPFEKEEFDAVSMAFGIRNINDKVKALKECHKVLKQDGKVYILELTKPSNKIINFLYFIYFKKILPFIGGMVSKSFSAYTYLPDSVLNFPTSQEFLLMMKKAGFINLEIKTLTLGITTIYSGQKKT